MENQEIVTSAPESEIVTDAPESEIVTEVINQPIKAPEPLDLNPALQELCDKQTSEIQVLRQKLAEVGTIAALPHGEPNCAKMAKNILSIIERK